VHLISKLRCDAALDDRQTGHTRAHPPRRKSGGKVDDANLPVQYLKETTVEEHIATCIYQMQLLHKEFTHPVHVVILVQTNEPLDISLRSAERK